MHCEVAEHITELVERSMILELIIYMQILLLKMEKIHCIKKIQSKQAEKTQAQTTMPNLLSPTDEQWLMIFEFLSYQSSNLWH